LFMPTRYAAPSALSLSAPRSSRRIANPLRRSLGGLLLGLGALSAVGASAQAFPTKPLRLVVTFPSGGAPDILARLFSEKAQLGFPVVVDNRPGAGGNIGADNVAKSPGDGHTIVMGTVGTHSINGALYEKMPYDMVKDFSPISLIASAPNLLVVNNALPVKNVPELIAYMKANPNKLSFGSPGIGTSVHVSGELFKSLTGTTMEHVPYKGRQFAIPDLIGGSIQIMFDNMPSALPGFEATTWFAMFAPANVPKPVIDRLNAEVLRVFKLPDVQERLKTLGLDAVLSSPDELARYQATEITKWAKVVKDSGAKAE
jgi:tripartite-type tricarboxylate transporter receptor subunit TctC